MKYELYNYEIFPMIFPAGEDVKITVKTLGGRVSFSGEYTVSVHRLDSGSPGQSFSASNRTDYTLTANEEGNLVFTYNASAEGELFVRIHKDGQRLTQLCVYALADDLARRIPLMGDLHLHTIRSDGNEIPAVTAANHRKRGCDFVVITDHGRYYPSLEARAAFEGVNTALNILPGEEVHLPETDTHIVNAGGLFSVNGLIESTANYSETGGEYSKRAIIEGAPDIVPAEQYKKEIDEIEASLTDCPENVNSRWYAVCVWAFEKIREADGLGIFAHPYWISDMWQMPEAFTYYMLEKHPFDAFEVLGGENYYEQNGFQTAIYYEEYSKGRVHPVVGSTDCHWSCELNRNYDICSTIVFAEQNERKSIITAIKDGYSVAVDTISKEYRLVGEFRLQKYASFLMENYFPIHHSQAQMDGELMRLYTLGEATAEEVNLISARSEKLMKKFILTK
ncbi:MAG: hypothetical protein E7658_02750 [Ruminococcaceae bacterium]|nr:hypothetical protein [Oscillospiraceae bacterium]